MSMVPQTRFAALASAGTSSREAWLLDSAQGVLRTLRKHAPRGSPTEADIAAAFGPTRGGDPFPVDFRLWPEFEPARVHRDCWVASSAGARVAAGAQCLQPLVATLLDAGWVAVDDVSSILTHIPHMRVTQHRDAWRAWSHAGVQVLMDRLLREGRGGCVLCPPWAVNSLRCGWFTAERLVLLLAVGTAGRAAISDAYRVGGEGAMREVSQAILPSMLHLTRGSP